MTEKTMRVVVARPGEPAKIEMIAEGYEGIRTAVDGPITAIALPASRESGRSMMAYGHDEALLEGLPWNRYIGPTYPIAGNLVVLASDNEGNDLGLTEAEAAEVARWLDTVCRRMDPTPSSLEEVEKLTGEPAVRFYAETEEGKLVEEWNSRDGDIPKAKRDSPN